MRIKRYSEFEWDTSEGLNGDIWEATFDFKPVATPRPKSKFRGNGLSLTIQKSTTTIWKISRIRLKRKIW
ncbi:hypothetical protein LOS25_17800 [Enterococcus faecium]|nr:hypothetical protein [Enterococcus faecium]